MWSVFISAAPPDVEELSARLWELGTTGIVEESGGVRAYFEGSADRTEVCRELSVDESAARSEGLFDADAFKPRDVEPLLVGNKFFVAPSWVSATTPAGRIRLNIDVTSAFGTGRHETTQLCMEALERFLKPEWLVADIGCGSGILSLAAAKLGAGEVISCDIHENSVIAAREVVDSKLFVGSADGLRAELFDVVVANLTEKVLDLVAYDLRRIAKPRGLVIISGFLKSNPPQRYSANETSQKDDWDCWICRREEIQAEPETSEPEPHEQQWWL